MSGVSNSNVRYGKILESCCLYSNSFEFHPQRSQEMHSNHDFNPIYRADTQTTTVNFKQQSQDQLVQVQVSCLRCRANLSKRSNLREQLCACVNLFVCARVHEMLSGFLMDGLNLYVQFIDVTTCELTKLF